jgi:hypothetical protein
MLTGRLRTLAERMVRELEETPGADLDKLMQALQVLKMARLEAQGRRGRRKLLSRAETGHDRRSRDEAIRAARTCTAAASTSITGRKKRSIS